MRCGGSPNPVPGALCCSAFSVAGSSLTSLSARRSLRHSILRRGGAFRAGPGCGCGRGFFSSLRSSAAPDGHGASITISSPRPSCAKRPLRPAGESPTSSGRPRAIPTRCCCRRDPAASASGSFERGPLPAYPALGPLGGHLIGALFGRWRKSQLFEQGHQSRIFVHHVNVDWRNPLPLRFLAEKHRHPPLEPQTPRERNDEQRTEAKAFERKSLILECAQVRKSTPSAEAIHCRDRCTLAIPSRQQLLTRWNRKGAAVAAVDRFGRWCGFAYLGAFKDEGFALEGFGLRSLFVVPFARGLGLERRMAMLLCQEAQRQGVSPVYVNVVDKNPRLVALLEELGFSPSTDQRADQVASEWAKRGVLRQWAALERS